MLRLVAGMLTLAAVVALATPAAAHERYFTYTYDWFTPLRGEKELELWWTQKQAGAVAGQVEIEYGITDRWVAAPYLLFGREHGGGYRYQGWKLEQRYRFGNGGPRKLLPAVYFEVKKERGEPTELEGKLIGSYLFGPSAVWSTNLIFEHKLESGSKVEIAYASGLSVTAGRRLRAGVELFGNFTEDEHFLGPVITYKLRDDTKILLTAGFKYRGEEDGAVRLIFEKEWQR